MKTKSKIICGLLSIVLCFCALIGIVGCSGSSESDNSESDNSEERIELTMDNYSKYIGLKKNVTVDTFSWTVIGTAILVHGTGTLTCTVYSKQPIKCYNVSLQFSSVENYGIAIGVNASCVTSLTVNIPSDGNYTFDVDLKFTNDSDESDDLFYQYAIYGRGKAEYIDTIESSYPFSLCKVSGVSGYVVVE